MQEKLRLGVGSWTTLGLIVAIMLVLNLISVNLFTQLDLTEGGVFSLSPATQNVLKSLDDRLIAKMYFTKDLPPPYNGYARYLKDQLEEYQAYAKGKLKLELIDPSEEGKETEAQRYGVPPLQVNAMENDKIEIKKVYMGLVLLFEDRKEVIPVVQNISGLEYDLTSAIKRLASRFLPAVGFLTGQDGPDLDQDLTYLNQALGRQYRVRRINLAEGNPIPADVGVLIILGPEKEFSESEKYAIDQFLMRGGKLAFLLNHVQVDVQKGSVEKQSVGLEDLLNNYGINIRDNLVIDLQCNRVAISQQQQGFIYQNVVNYPFFPAATDFDKNNMMVKNLGTVSFYFVSSLDPVVQASSKGVQFDPIVSSSPHSGSQPVPCDINPYRKFSQADFNQNNLTLAATLQGSFPSYFAGKEKPPAASGSSSSDSTLSSSIPTRLVVVGDADWVTDQNVRGMDNLTFFLNMVDWLSQDEALIAIRSKQVTTRPLKEISVGAKRLVKYGNTLGLPFLVILFGVVRWQIRRQYKGRNLPLMDEKKTYEKDNSP
jgi:gliding-associated putative ABC transporter substrate-binding component GldG